MASDPLPRWLEISLPLLVGGLMATPGLLLILTGFAVINLYPDEWTGGMHWVFVAIGLPFFSWGVWIASNAFLPSDDEDSTARQTLSHFLILGNLLPFAIIFLWGGFGPGERHFVVETTSGMSSVTRPGNELVGRCIYGGVGVSIAVISYLYMRHYIKGNEE